MIKEYHENLTPEKMLALIDQLSEGENHPMANEVCFRTLHLDRTVDI